MNIASQIYVPELSMNEAMAQNYIAAQVLIVFYSILE